MLMINEANKSSKIEDIETSIKENFLGEEHAKPEKKDKIIEVEECLQSLIYGAEKVKNGEKVYTKLLTEMHEILMKNSKIEYNKPR